MPPPPSTNSTSRPVRRLAAAHWGLLVVCAGFLLAGALVLDDFGISTDEGTQRRIGQTALDYLAGEGEQALDQVYAPQDRYYGVAFEAPLALVERALGLEDSRDVYLSRHLLTHLFFLAGGVFSYVLVLRMFGSRLLALVAMTLFLLHPRLYAHSFFNSKDIPFAAMFMIALYLTHRAFRRETLGAFLLCGVGVGVLVNLRLLGLILFAAVLALRALDLLFAGGAVERKRILLAGGAFALAAPLTYYAAFPVLWTDPFGGFGEAWTLAARHVNPAVNLFRGEWLYAPDGPPLEYIPVWMGITTPPLALLLAVVGAAGLCWRALRHPRDLWRATPLRFNLLLALLVVVPIGAIFVGRSNIYDGWRQVYFLYAPLALLATVGLHWLLSSADHRCVRAGGYLLAGAGVAVALVSMARIHPLEDSYYNGLVDRTTPDYLLDQYAMDYWMQSHRRLVKNIAEDHPEQEILVALETSWKQYYLLNESEKGRISLSSHILPQGFYSDQPVSGREYEIRIYNNTVTLLKGKQLEQGEKREALLRAALVGESLAPLLPDEPVVQAAFDIYHDERLLVFVRNRIRCEDWANSFRRFIRIHVYPVDPADLPDESVREGYDFDNQGFFIWDYAASVDDRCIIIMPLPGYPIDNIAAGWDSRADGGQARFALVPPPDVDPAVLAGEPLVGSVFDVYRDGDRLVYVRDACAERDVETAFFLHIYPVDANDLPDESRRHGFENRDFYIWERGSGRRLDGRCVAVARLPEYPIASVRTGQLGEDGQPGRWAVRFSLASPPTASRVPAGDPLASSTFDIYRDGAELVYVRDGCTDGDAEAAFFLHVVPVDAGDLPAASRPHGFENRDFFLWQRGGRWKERCTATVPLPEYPIASVRTGQYDEAGRLWAVEFALAGGE